MRSRVKALYMALSDPVKRSGDLNNTMTVNNMRSGSEKAASLRNWCNFMLGICYYLHVSGLVLSLLKDREKLGENRPIGHRFTGSKTP